MPELVSQFLVEAARDQKRDPPPAGTEYLVRMWDPKSKPATGWSVGVENLQIRKTYCLQAQYIGGSRQLVRWTNRFFSLDSARPAQELTLTVSKYTIEKADRDWRRGHYGNARWNRALPERGDRNAVVARFQDLAKRIPDCSHQNVSSFEQKLSRYHRHLANARARQGRKRKVVEEMKAPTSSSSSSSSSSSDSSEGS